MKSNILNSLIDCRVSDIEIIYNELVDNTGIISLMDINKINTIDDLKDYITNGKYNLLKWDRQEQVYYPIEINLFEKGLVEEN